MKVQTQLKVWLAVLAAFLLFVYLLSSILLPFIAGMALAYFLDPIADWLEAKGFSRTLATLTITGVFVLVFVTLLVVLVPLLQHQAVGFASRLPDYLARLQELAAPLIEQIQARLGAEEMEKLRAMVGSYSGEALKWLGGIAKSVLSGGAAIFSLLSLVLIMPLVAFYLLRDWDRIVARVDSWLPRPAAPTIRAQIKEIDRTLSGFLRGQATVCLILATFYGVGLSLVGLDFGLVVGLCTGLISFVPYFGMGVGLVTGFSIAVAQWGLGDPVPLLLVAGVFGAGQIMEGFFLTPKLVGDSVGLHPVWIIFALMAGAALLGFTGVLLAVPTAAVIGVVTRFLLGRYQESPMYLGAAAQPGEDDPARE